MRSQDEEGVNDEEQEQVEDNTFGVCAIIYVYCVIHMVVYIMYYMYVWFRCS